MHTREWHERLIQMWLRSGQVVFFLAMWLVSPESRAVGAVPSPDELIRVTIDSRMQIRTFDIEIEFDAKHTPMLDDGLQLRVRYDGERFRVDDHRVYPKSKRFEGLTQESYWERTVYGKHSHKRFNSMVLKGPGQLVVQIHEDAETVDREYDYAATHMDFRALGFDCAGVLTSSSVTEVMETLATKEKSVHEDSVDGIDCLRLDLELVSKSKVSFWIAPQMGHCILRVVGKNDEVGITDEVKLTAAQWKGSGIWFPASYAHTRRRGDQAFDLEAGKVTVHSINEAIPADAFELTTLEIPVGRSVQTVPHPGGPKTIWDGEKIIVRGERPAAPQAARRGSIVLLINAVAAFLLVIVFIVRGIRRRKASEANSR